LIEPYVIAINITAVNNNKMEAIRTHTAGLTWCSFAIDKA